MTEIPCCPQCKGQLAADAPQGLCPECLLKAGLESGDSLQEGSEASEPSPQRARFVPPAPQELAKLFPQLEVLELVGSGGMAAVYKARQPDLDRFVALKILPPEVGQDPAFAERFTLEAQTMARLSHPNIVSVYDFGRADGLYYFVMEFVDGVNLRQMIQAGQLEPRQALAIVPEVCAALQYAHDEGVVHRDIKPENVLVDQKGRVKIADFGLAKLLGSDTARRTLSGAGQVLGTPYYMAPEQMERPREVDHRADIYSLGVVFYEMLTGELPLGRFDPPSHKVEVDVRLDEVVLRTLEREPERRYQKASEIGTEVESISGRNRVEAPIPHNSHKDSTRSAQMSENVTGSVSAADGSGPSQIRICKLPVIGALWGSLGLILLACWFVVQSEVSTGGPPAVSAWQWFARVVILPLGALAPFACTTLGCLGISKIRRSRGQLIGLPLAVGVTLFYPVLILDAIVFYVIYYHVCGEERWELATVISLLIIGVVDWYLFRAAWRAAAKTTEPEAVGDAVKESEMSRPAGMTTAVAGRTSRRMEESDMTNAQASFEAKRTSGLAIASLILSCLIVTVIPGIICGHLARAACRKNPALKGVGMASAGLIIGYTLLAVGLLAAFVIFALTGSPGTPDPTPMPSLRVGRADAEHLSAPKLSKGIESFVALYACYEMSQ